MMVFHFTISDLATFLGKSPATIRSWERKGLLTFPRVGANRSLTVDEVRHVAQIAHQAGRITTERRILIGDALTTLHILEEETA